MNIKKIIIPVLLFCVAIVSLCSCQLSETQEKIETESKLPELKIGVDRLKPFFYVDENGEYKGIDAEIAKEACKRAGYRPDFVEISWGIVMIICKKEVLTAFGVLLLRMEEKAIISGQIPICKVICGQ